MQRDMKKALYTKKSASKPKRVVVALRMAGPAGQDKLNGIFSYLGEDRRWQLIIYRTKFEFTAQVVRNELSLGADGFIVGIPGTEDAMAVLAGTDAPLVVTNIFPSTIERRAKNIAFVFSDDEEIGREAANDLLRHGIYKSYGYASYRDEENWCKARARGWRDTLDKAGFVGRMLDATHYKDDLKDKSVVAKWLKSLPKPCGIFAACDDRAFEILDICKENGLKIPSEVGILGVNNDLILCENTEPRLSSVQPDFIEEGRLAAELLDRIMSGRDLADARRVHRVGVKRIVHRESTVPESASGKLVQKVLAYINANAVKGIGVGDVARRFKVSRSLLEMRFNQLQGESLYETMLRVRLDEVKRRLRQTDDSIAAITAECGWANPAPPKALFKRRFGCSMREYRSAAKSSAV